MSAPGRARAKLSVFEDYRAEAVPLTRLFRVCLCHTTRWEVRECPLKTRIHSC